MLDKCVSDYLLFKVNHVLHRGIKNSPHIPWLHKMSSYAWSLFRASLVAQMVKNEPAMQETTGGDAGVGNIPWRREWQPTPVFLPGKSHGQRSLVGYSLRGRKESDITDQVTT